MTTVTLRFDDETKRELDEMVNEMGMNLTTFFMVYAKRALRDRKIPFEINAPVEAFFGAANTQQLAKAERQIAEGKTVTKTMAELETMADE